MPIATTEKHKQHVSRTQGVCGGKPCISGTRVRVWDIAVRAQSGESPDEILASFPQLELADVYAGLAYFYDNREEIERTAAEDEQLATTLAQQAATAKTSTQS